MVIANKSARLIPPIEGLNHRRAAQNFGSSWPEQVGGNEIACFALPLRNIWKNGIRRLHLTLWWGIWRYPRLYRNTPSRLIWAIATSPGWAPWPPTAALRRPSRL